MNRDELNRGFKELTPSEEQKKRMWEAVVTEKPKGIPFRRVVPLLAALFVMVVGLYGISRLREDSPNQLSKDTVMEMAAEHSEELMVSPYESYRYLGQISEKEGSFFFTTKEVLLGEEPLQAELEDVHVEEGYYFLEVSEPSEVLSPEFITALYTVEDEILTERVLGDESYLEKPTSFFK